MLLRLMSPRSLAAFVCSWSIDARIGAGAAADTGACGAIGAAIGGGGGAVRP
jgi:hypothetical protein